MCTDQKIPHVNRIKNIGNFVRTHDVGFFDGMGRNRHPDAYIDDENYAIGRLDVSSLAYDLRNASRITLDHLEMPGDYEGIFSAPSAVLRRRNQRSFFDPNNDPDAEAEGVFMFELCMECWDHPERQADRCLDGDLSLLDNIIARHLPARLDLNSWVAGEILRVVAGDHLYRESGHQEELMEWRHWFGPARLQWTGRPTNGDLQFLGPASPGRLIWMPPQGLPEPTTVDMLDFYKEAEMKLRNAEKALIAISRRIARYVAIVVIEDYAIPEAQEQGRAILDREQVGRAVREILGEAWFDLPFDVDNELRNWSEDDVLKPDHDGSGNLFIGGGDDSEQVRLPTRAELNAEILAGEGYPESPVTRPGAPTPARASNGNIVGDMDDLDDIE